MLLSVCSTLWDQLWVRKQSTYAWRWGVSDFYKTEPQRTEFKGKYELDPISNTRKKINNSGNKGKKCFGYSVSGFFVVLVLVAVVFLTIYQAYLRNKHEDNNASMIGVANAIQIKIFNFVRTT